ncbi:MAG: leucine-rich repeat protein [Solobacterium sp.]|nr:leucine-rich repeat protein [Solobacterium sp.]
MYKKLFAVLMSLFLSVTVLPQSVYAEEEAEETAEGIVETEETVQEEEVIPDEVTEEELPAEIIEETAAEEPAEVLQEEETSGEPESEMIPEETGVEPATEGAGEPKEEITDTEENIQEEEVIPEEVTEEGKSAESIPEEAVLEEPAEVLPEVEAPEEVIPEETKEETVIEETPEQEDPQDGSAEEIIEEEIGETGETAEAKYYEDFEYVSNGTQVKITGYRGNSTDLVIPSSIHGQPVVKIGWQAFYETDLTSIFLPDSVKTIDYAAFMFCRSLKKVTISASYTNISSDAFRGCTAIETAGPIGSGADFEFGWTKSIPENAFKYCTGLTSVTIPEGIKNVKRCAFQYCSSLKHIVMPASVTNIDYYAFYECTAIETAGPVGSGADYEFGWTKSIPQGAFWWCSNLLSVTIPEGIKKIGDGAFYNCKKTESFSYSCKCNRYWGRSYLRFTQSIW